MTNITDNIDIEEIKKGLTDEIIPYFADLFPDNKIPLYISPLSKTNDNYLAWSAYSSEGPNSTFTDNYCRPDETGRLFYPTDQDDLKPCDNFFTQDINNLLDLNEQLLTTINDVKLDTNVEVELSADKIQEELEAKISEYTELKSKLNSESKTMNNLNNISKIINELSVRLNKREKETDNEVNINIDSVEEEKYRYAPTNYYIYTIAVLIVLIFIIHFTVLYY
jgi:hypothetical protein